MKSCSSAHCVLVLLTIAFSIVWFPSPDSVSADPAVKVELHGSATLSCSERCSGLVRWTVFSKLTETLAECDQTSCRSVKEGYQMIHHQYLNGDLSLIITDADFSKRARYTCDCDHLDICDVILQIEPLNTRLQIKAGETLLLDLDVSDPVEVMYNSTEPAGPSSGQICRVNGRSLQCRPEYTQRVSLTSNFELRGVTPSDSGVYSIRDIKYNEIIHTYRVTIQDDQRRLDRDLRSVVPVWKLFLSKFSLVAGLAAVLTATVLVFLQPAREVQKLCSLFQPGCFRRGEFSQMVEPT